MIDTDSKMFGAEMALLGEVFGEQLSSTRVRAYFEALNGFETDEVRGAIRRAIKTSHFFPRPAELIETIRAARREVNGLRPALPPPKELTKEEQAEIEVDRAAFRAIVGRERCQLFTTHSPDVRVDDLAEHERRKQRLITEAKTQLAGSDVRKPPARAGRQEQAPREGTA